MSALCNQDDAKPIILEPHVIKKSTLCNHDGVKPIIVEPHVAHEKYLAVCQSPGEGTIHLFAGGNLPSPIACGLSPW